MDRRNPTETHRQTASRIIVHALMLITSLAPALIVGIHSLSRPYVLMGSDQDLLWASEALRLLRGVGPSYADHPGALWPIVYGLNIEVLSVVFPNQITDPLGAVLPSGISKVIAMAKIENALICGLTGYLAFGISRLLGTKLALAALLNGVLSFSYPILNAAQSIRHEIPSMVLLLATIPLAHQLAQQAWGTWTRNALGIMVACLIFAAAYSKQQSLISLPYCALLATLVISNADPAGLAEVKSWLARIGPAKLSILALSCSIPWLISATPDIDLINLPAWAAINAGLALLLVLAGINRDGMVKPWAAIATMAVIEVAITKMASPNWWRQAVTGFPSWLFAFSRNGGDSTTSFISGIQEYFSNLFNPPWIAAFALVAATIVAAFRLANRVIKRPRTTVLEQQSSAWNQAAWADTGWLLIAPILLASTARVNPPYGVYFFPPIVISAAHVLSLKHVTPWPTGLRTALVSLCSIAILLTASIQSLSNAQHLSQFTSSGLPEQTICLSQNMDQSMHRTAVGQCPAFSQEAAKKMIFDDWRGPH